MSPSEYWRLLYQREIAGERVIAGLHAIEELEKIDSYKKADLRLGFDPTKYQYFERVQRSLSLNPPT